MVEPSRRGCRWHYRPFSLTERLFLLAAGIHAAAKMILDAEKPSIHPAERLIWLPLEHIDPPTQCLELKIRHRALGLELGS